MERTIAGSVKRDDDFLVGEIEGFQGDVSTVSPGAHVVGIKGDCGEILS